MSCDPSAPGNQNLELFEDDSFDRTFTFTVNGVATDVSSLTFAGAIHDADGNEVLSLVFDTSEAEDGIVYGDVALDLDPGFYTWSAQFTDGSKTHTFSGGQLLIKARG